MEDIVLDEVDMNHVKMFNRLIFLKQNNVVIIKSLSLVNCNINKIDIIPYIP